MNPGDVVIYRDMYFTGRPLVAMIINEDEIWNKMRGFDFKFYRILTEEGNVLVVGDTKLTPV